MYKIKRFSSLTDDTKLKASDKSKIWINKNLTTQGLRNHMRDSLEGNDRYVNRQSKIGAALGGLMGAMSGAGLGGAKGALIGTAVGVPSGYFLAKHGTKSGLKMRENLLNKSETHKEALEKQSDRLDIAEGKMSKSDFAKKWYKDKK